VPLRPPSCSTAVRSGRDNCSAGARPKSRPVTIGCGGCGEDHGVEGHVLDARQARRAYCDEELRRRPRHRQAKHAAEQRQYDALGEEEADDLASRCAEGGTHRHFAPANVCAGEQEISDVGARDKQHETYGAEEHEQRTAHAACDEVLNGNGRAFEGAEAPIRLGADVRCPHPSPGDHREFARRALG
jgi:hypothetical protein